jgi:ApaG protein
MAPLSEISKKINIITKTQYHGVKNNQHVFSYIIQIENHSDQAIKLLRRKWLIKDVLHPTREVEGDGVVGETPTILPSESFSYNSWCPINSEFGEMSGYYTFVNTLSNEEFEVEIPAFNLIPKDLTN